MLDWVGAGLRNMHTDVGLDQLMTLAFTAATLNPNKIANVVLPGSTGMAGDISIVDLDQAVLQAISTDIQPDGLLAKKNIPPSPNAELLPAEG